MDKHGGLDELLNYVDNSPDGEANPSEELDLKSPSTKSDESTLGEDTSEGTEDQEEDITQEGGDEESGEESSSEGTKSSEIMALKLELAELKKLFKKDEPTEIISTSSVELKPVIQQIDVFGGQSFENIIEDESSFKSWATQLVSKVQEVTQEAVYRQIPQMVTSYVDQQVEGKSQATEFYTANPDLQQYKAEVAKNATLIANAEPNLSREEFFKRTAEYTRYMLKLDAPIPKGDSAPVKKTKPALNKRSSKANERIEKAPTLEGIDAEINQMMELID